MARSLFPIALLMVLAAPAAAQPLCDLPVSAFLTDGDGVALTGDVDVELRFYVDDAPAALPVECRTLPTATLDGGWLRVSVDVCEAPAGGDCGSAAKVVGFCNGPVCPQSPTAMKAMIREGFPAQNIFYYRGGMLVWDALGLTTVEGDF